MIDDAERDWAVMHHPAAVLALGEAHRLANQRLTQIDLGTAPADRTIAMDPPQRRVGWVFRLAQDAVPAPRRESPPHPTLPHQGGGIQKRARFRTRSPPS
jgi:hypothetical protein